MLYEKENEVISLKLNATGTNRLDWFSQANLISSPWNDLTSTANLLFFNMTGGWNRYFEITKSCGGCSADVGWLVITGGGCPWETRVAIPIIQYNIYYQFSTGLIACSHRFSIGSGGWAAAACTHVLL